MAETQAILDQKQQIFDRWAPSYDWILPSVFYQAVHQRLLEYVTFPPEPHVLDLGCGTGRLLRRLAAEVSNLSGVGLDLSAEMLAQAQEKTQRRDRLQFLSGRSDAIPLEDKTFDSVFCTISFLHYPDPQAVMGEVARVLKPGGIFYLADYVPSEFLGVPQQGWLTSPFGLRFYDRAMRQKLADGSGLICRAHQYLLGPIMLTLFQRV